MERYWERKAEKRKNETKAAAEKTKTVTTKRTTKTVSTVTVKETELFEWLFPEPHVTEVTVSRNGQSDADRKSTRLNSSHPLSSRMPSSA